jgi:hypothetical protein
MQGTRKHGINRQDYAAVYAEGDKPRFQPGEHLDKKPFPIKVEDSKEKIDNMSRLNFSRIYTVEHNVKVLKVGRIPDNYLPQLNRYFVATITGSDPDVGVPSFDSVAMTPRVASPQPPQLAGVGILDYSTQPIQSSYGVPNNQYTGVPLSGYAQAPSTMAQGYNRGDPTPIPTHALMPASDYLPNRSELYSHSMSIPYSPSSHAYDPQTTNDPVATLERAGYRDSGYTPQTSLERATASGYGEYGSTVTHGRHDTKYHDSTGYGSVVPTERVTYRSEYHDSGAYTNAARYSTPAPDPPVGYYEASGFVPEPDIELPSTEEVRNSRRRHDNDKYDSGSGRRRRR